MCEIALVLVFFVTGMLALALAFRGCVAKTLAWESGVGGWNLPPQRVGFSFAFSSALSLAYKPTRTNTHACKQHA